MLDRESLSEKAHQPPARGAGKWEKRGLKLIVIAGKSIHRAIQSSYLAILIGFVHRAAPHERSHKNIRGNYLPLRVFLQRSQTCGLPPKRFVGPTVAAVIVTAAVFVTLLKMPPKAKSLVELIDGVHCSYNLASRIVVVGTGLVTSQTLSATRSSSISAHRSPMR